jgi:hypothetical protein
MADLAILCGGGPGVLERRFSDLAAFLGAESSLIQVCSPISVDGLARQLGPQVKGLGMSASTLELLKKELKSPEPFVSWLTGNGRQVFAFGFEPTPQHEALAGWLTNGSVRKLVPIGKGDRCIFPTAGRTFTRQLAGTDFPRSPRGSDGGFEIDPANPSLTTLMSFGAKANFVHVGGLESGLFLWAGNDIPALKQTFPPDTDLSAFYDSVLPPLVFLRSALRGSCWENPVKTARVIIDDPLLTGRYGFLDYREVLRSLERLDYALTIAFVPWNYLRTTREDAQFFLANSRRFSICVHGCDHTRHEFGVTDSRLLERKARLAMERLEEHQQRTGLPFERVMVFPQGVFTTAAMSALRRSGYLAAVNSTQDPTDQKDSLTIADELLPATNRHAGFPVFHRRYPKNSAHFPVDLFLGKPAHIVGHHDIFEHGCEALEACVGALKQIEPELTWPGLSSALEGAHLRKQPSEGTLDVRFFTNTFQFAHTSDRHVTCRFSKLDPQPDIIKAVQANDRSIEFEAGSESIAFQMELKPGEKVRIRLDDRAGPSETVFSPGLPYRFKTGARRHLSEFRDNHLARRPRLLKLVKGGLILYSKMKELCGVRNGD